jgi:hypothetical protein
MKTTRIFFDIVEINALTGEFVSASTVTIKGVGYIEESFTEWDELKPYIISSAPWEASASESD